MGTPLTFKASAPYATELIGKLHKPRNSISSGSLKTTLEFVLDLNDDDKRQLKAIVTVVVDGMIPDADDKAFTVSVTMECEYNFSAELTEKELNDQSFVRMVCEPLYHRGAVIVEQSARTMGFSSIRVATTFPQESLELGVVIPEKLAEPKPKRAKRKTAQKTS
ncbi:hypothetical protein [Azonexus sp.]|uniref:hypothetical protein n=1 Tax=Azonexus sp. TaxID=1872668 RepID=UPI0035B076BE